MKTMLRAALAILIIAVVACSQKGLDSRLIVEPKPVPGVDFTQYKTWSWGRQGEYVQTGIEALDAPEFRAGVGNHTISEMSKLGYTHVDGAPDMLLMFHVAVEERYDEVKMNPAYQGYDMAGANVNSDDMWKEGSLIMFVIDAKSGQQIWGSTATAELDELADYETKKKRFNEVITKMLADFPKRPQ